MRPAMISSTSSVPRERQAAFELGSIDGGSTNTRTKIVTRLGVEELLRALPVDVEQHIAALPPASASHRRTAACRSGWSKTCAHSRKAPASTISTKCGERRRSDSRRPSTARQGASGGWSRKPTWQCHRPPPAACREIVVLPAPEGEDSTNIRPRRAERGRFRSPWPLLSLGSERVNVARAPSRDDERSDRLGARRAAFREAGTRCRRLARDSAGVSGAATRRGHLMNLLLRDPCTAPPWAARAGDELALGDALHGDRTDRSALGAADHRTRDRSRWRSPRPASSRAELRLLQKHDQLTRRLRGEVPPQRPSIASGTYDAIGRSRFVDQAPAPPPPASSRLRPCWWACLAIFAALS